MIKMKGFAPCSFITKAAIFSFFIFPSKTGCEEKLRLLKAENSLLKSQLADLKAMESDSQATIQNQEITINSLKKEKEVCIL